MCGIIIFSWGCTVYFRGVKSVVFCILSAILTAGCQTTAAVQSQQPFRITQVEVTKATSDIGTVNLAEDVRYKTLREAYRYAEIGQEKILKIQLTQLHFKNAVTSLLVGDNNRLSAKAQVVDKATGNVIAKFDTVASNKGALNGISGAIISAAQNHIETEQQLSTHLANRLLLQVYGNAYAKTIRERVASKKITPSYPRRYEDLKLEHYCASKTQSEPTDNFDNTNQVQFAYPEECKKLASSSQ